MAEENRIRYIIGAGASAKAIKTVVNFGSMFSDWIGTHIHKSLGKTTMEQELFEEINDLLSFVSNGIDPTFSVDTYARMLWLRNDKESLAKLKTAITLIMILEQETRNHDNRYDIFLGSLLQKEEERISFPENIQIVSWNYDYQLELSLSRILDVDLRDIVNHDVYKSILRNKQLIKINGSVLYDFPKTSIEEIPVKSKNLYAHKYKELLRDAQKTVKRENESLGCVRFSWENKFDSSGISGFNPNVTVVVGYSFPTFNRLIDLQLLEGVIGANNHRIYIQCNAPNSTSGNEEVKSKLLAMGVSDRNILEVQSSNEFLLPYEFNLPPKDRRFFAV